MLSYVLQYPLRKYLRYSLIGKTSMILYTDATTPFGRKCLVAALERNIALEERFVNLSDPQEFLFVNPLNQIPALSVGQQNYFDSDVILQFLDTLHKGPPLISEKNKQNVQFILIGDGPEKLTLIKKSIDLKLKFITRKFIA